MFRCAMTPQARSLALNPTVSYQGIEGKCVFQHYREQAVAAHTGSIERRDVLRAMHTQLTATCASDIAGHVTSLEVHEQLVREYGTFLLH